MIGGVTVGFRFRKSIVIAPGVRLNVGSKGVGVSVGGKRVRKSVNASGGGRSSVRVAPGLTFSTTSRRKKRK